MPTIVCDFLCDGIAYYYPRDRKELLKGYRRFSFQVKTLTDGRSCIQEIFVCGNLESARQLAYNLSRNHYPYEEYAIYEGYGN